MNRFAQLFPESLPIIGTVRLPPLPDRPGSPGLADLVEFALHEVAALQQGGADGALIINYHDRPFRVRAQPETIAAMTRITRAVVERRGDLLIGCQILINDPIASLAVAKTSGADFIRCDHFVDPMERPDHGVLTLDPDGLMAYRDEIGAHDVLVLADIQHKYATMLERRSLKESARQACLHGADAVIVTGSADGKLPEDADLRDALQGIEASARDVPLLLGGGLTPDNAAAMLGIADGAIVGSSVMEDGRTSAERVASLLRAVTDLR